MIGLFGVLLLVAGLLILPGWLWTRRRRGQSAWVFLLPVLGLIIWVLLAALGIGAQSLSNLVETAGVVAGAVAIAYLKLFLFDRKFEPEKRSMLFSILLVVLVGLAFRLFTPELPEGRGRVHQT